MAGPTADNRFSYGRSVQFSDDVDLARVGVEFARVACYGRRYSSLLYTDFHALVLLKPHVEKRCRRAAKTFVADRRPTDVRRSSSAVLLQLACTYNTERTKRVRWPVMASVKKTAGRDERADTGLLLWMRPA